MKLIASVASGIYTEIKTKYIKDEKIRKMIEKDKSINLDELDYINLSYNEINKYGLDMYNSKEIFDVNKFTSIIVDSMGNYPYYIYYQNCYINGIIEIMNFNGFNNKITQKSESIKEELDDFDCDPFDSYIYKVDDNIIMIEDISVEQFNVSGFNEGRTSSSHEYYIGITEEEYEKYQDIENHKDEIEKLVSSYKK